MNKSDQVGNHFLSKPIAPLSLRFSSLWFISWLTFVALWLYHVNRFSCCPVQNLLSRHWRGNIGKLFLYDLFVFFIDWVWCGMVAIISYPWLWHVQVYVLGTAAKLGKWKVENGLRLNYVDDSTWEADCLIPKADFPIKYPYFTFFQTNLLKLFHTSLLICFLRAGFLTVISHIDTVKFIRKVT